VSFKEYIKNPGRNEEKMLWNCYGTADKTNADNFRRIVYNYAIDQEIKEHAMPKVCVIRCDSYNRDQVQQAIDKAFKEFGAEDLFRSDEKILLKPNLLASKTPDKAVTTHPEVFRAVAVALGRCRVKLSYGDSPATDSLEKAGKICGIEEVANELSIPQADFITPVHCDYMQGDLARQFQFVKAVSDNDGIVSISKFKTHALTRFTGAMKNQFGLVPGTLKAKDHVRFPTEQAFTQMIADLNKCVRPRLFVMDAIVGNGPMNGTPRALDMLFVSDDPVALDSVCVGIMGLDYRSISIVKTGERNGIGIADPAKIEFCLIENVDGIMTVRWDMANKMIPLLRIPDFNNSVKAVSAISLMNTFLGPVTKKIIINRPTIIPDKCTKCRHCIQVCPLDPKAIEFSEKKQKIVYHYERCIRCFCCQELCPHAAIEVKKAPLSFILKG